MTLDTRTAEATIRLRDVVTAHSPATFSSSFGAEDMVILDLIEKLELDVEVFTLDTGHLHDETHALIALAREKYQRPIRIMHPDADDIESFVAEHGINAFYDSVESRKRCCAIRKIAPLRRALEGNRLWITGLRRGQSVTRSDSGLLAYDSAHGLFKLNPLVDWSTEEVFEYLQRFDVPSNALHAKGFPSIGCAPCTRAVKPGEDERSGRWWWEQPESRECGLHMDPQGRLVRTISTSADVSTYARTDSQ
jgi:phosphoadenosine phosphosulfate reductase